MASGWNDHGSSSVQPDPAGELTMVRARFSTA